MWLPHHRILGIILVISYAASRSSEATTIATGNEASGDWDFTATGAYLLARAINDSLDVTTHNFKHGDGSTTFVPYTKANSNESDASKYLEGATTPRNDEIDIVPIVGAVCGVTGLLVGVTISAVVWFYITKKRMRQQAARIHKNPEEKTFERLDYNLTLPRQPRQPTATDSPSSVQKSLSDSGYLHFEEPTPYDDDACHSLDLEPQYGAQIHCQRQSRVTVLDVDDESQCGKYVDDAVFEYSEPSSQTTAQAQRPRSVKYSILPSTKFRNDSSVGGLTDKDLSNHSTTSKRSGSTVGAERRSSVCTCRTDLPDTDASNCSTCGGSVSVTSSFAREKPHPALSGYRDHIHDFVSFIPADETTFTELPPSTNFQEPTASSDIILRPHNELCSLSSADSFIHEDRDDWDGQTTNHDNMEDPLKYFGLELPPSTFSNPQKTGRTYYQAPTCDSDCINAEKSCDNHTLKDANSETTIDL